MTTGAPLACVYDADANGDSVFRVMRRFQKEADCLYTHGERYVCEIVEMAQSAKDRGYHARINEAWATLPEEFDGQFPTANDFRAWLLISCGYCTKIRSPFPSEKEAKAAVPLIMALRTGFCQVEAEGDVVVVTVALSQKLSEARGGMPADRRAQSYKDTEDLAASLIGVSPRRLEREAGQSA